MFSLDIQDVYPLGQARRARRGARGQIRQAVNQRHQLESLREASALLDEADEWQSSVYNRLVSNKNHGNVGSHNQSYLAYIAEDRGATLSRWGQIAGYLAIKFRDHRTHTYESELRETFDHFVDADRVYMAGDHYGLAARSALVAANVARVAGKPLVVAHWFGRAALRAAEAWALQPSGDRTWREVLGSVAVLSNYNDADNQLEQTIFGGIYGPSEHQAEASAATKDELVA